MTIRESKSPDNLFRYGLDKILADIRNNCQISDARFSGSYSMCILILRLRNFYKWEQGMEPWAEPDPPDLLEWIDAREKVWESVLDEPLHSLDFNGQVADPLDGGAVNMWLKDSGLFYGAGYGRSMKPIFFLAEKKEERTVAGAPLFILGKEWARELAAPFAMNQEEIIYIRRDPLRFYFWDQIQEIRYGGKKSLQRALQIYKVLDSDGNPDRELLIKSLDHIVDTELDTFVHHEVGELKEEALKSEVSKKIIEAYPYSTMEYLSRAVKDLLADTHPSGLFAYVISEKRETALSFYISFLDGLRSLLFPEINGAYDNFMKDGDWRHINRATVACRDKMLRQAEKINHVIEMMEEKSHQEVEEYMENEILRPLGLGRGGD